MLARAEANLLAKVNTWQYLASPQPSDASVVTNLLAADAAPRVGGSAHLSALAVVLAKPCRQRLRGLVRPPET